MSNQISILGNLSSGILVMNQANVTFPTNPTIGMLVINGLDLYAYITIAGITNWYPIVQKNLNPSNYVGSEVIPAVTWIVQHNLNTINYYYVVQNLNGNTITPTQLIPIDNNSFKLVFSTAQSGKIVVIDKDNLFIDEFAIGDGTSVKITKADQEQLNLIAGPGISVAFNNVTKSITIAGQGLASATDLYATQSQLNASIAAEASRAELAEDTLTTNLSTETINRVNAVTTLTTNLNSEISRAQSAEGTLTINLSNEISARSTAITNEIGNRNTAITVESNRAIAAEGVLTTNVTNVTTTANNAVPKTTTVNGHALSSNVTVTATDVGLGNVNNTSDLNKPVSTAVTTAISTETTNRTNADTAIQNEVNLIETGAGLNADGTYTTPTGTVYLGTASNLKSADVLLDTAVANEVTNRTNAVTTLTTNLSTETTNRVNGDNANAASITTVSNLLNSTIANISNAVPLTYGGIGSSQLITSTTTVNQILDSFPITKYRTARYLVQITYGAQFQASEFVCMHDGTNTYMMDIYDMYTGSGYLATFSTTIVSGNFELLISPALSGLTINVVRTSIVV